MRRECETVEVGGETVGVCNKRWWGRLRDNVERASGCGDGYVTGGKWSGLERAIMRVSVKGRVKEGQRTTVPDVQWKLEVGKDLDGER
jgi:hypothetical protein